VPSLAAFQECLTQQQLEDVSPETYNFASLTTPAAPVSPEWSLFAQHPTTLPFPSRRYGWTSKFVF